MLILLGLALFMVPFILMITYGIKKSIQTMGGKATFIMGLSIPFYMVMVRALFNDALFQLGNIMNKTHGLKENTISRFEWISIEIFWFLMILSGVFEWIHTKNIKERK